MPKDNIERTIKRGPGGRGHELRDGGLRGLRPGWRRGHGQGADRQPQPDGLGCPVRFAKDGGNLGTNGSVAYLFEQRWILVVPAEEVDEDELMELALEAGADDVRPRTRLRRLGRARDFPLYVRLEKAGVRFESAELSIQPQNRSRPRRQEGRGRDLTAHRPARENDDVQDVYANFDIPERVLEVVRVLAAAGSDLAAHDRKPARRAVTRYVPRFFVRSV